MVERQTRNCSSLRCCSPRSFCLVSGLRVWCHAGEEGAVGGLEICCGAWAVRHIPFGPPDITLSHLSIHPGWAESLAGSAALSPGNQEIIEPRCQSFWPEICLYGGASSSLTWHRGTPSSNASLSEASQMGTVTSNEYKHLELPWSYL
jgi:hypothetical protein